MCLDCIDHSAWYRMACPNETGVIYVIKNAAACAVNFKLCNRATNNFSFVVYRTRKYI
jgi:hypothetical protein